MPVYVDDMRAWVGRYILCHMIADSSEELLAMVDKIGLPRKYIQYAGTPREHFDVGVKKRSMAIFYGAIPITQRELGRKIRDRRKEAIHAI